MKPRPYLLCGGRSRRMGRDKAMLEHPEGTTLLERAARLLETAIGPPLLLSGDGRRYPQFDYAELADPKPDCGPLGGILAAVDDASPSPALILAVDMPFVLAEDLAALMAAAGPGVTLAVAEGRRHPALSIWSPATLPALRDALEAGELALMPLLDRLEVREVELPASRLANWNRPPTS